MCISILPNTGKLWLCELVCQYQCSWLPNMLHHFRQKFCFWKQLSDLTVLCVEWDIKLYTYLFTYQHQMSSDLTGPMAIKRVRRNAESSDSDATGDDSVSGDGWGSSAGESVTDAKTARTTDVAVDYSIASSGHRSSEESTVTRSANAPRRHTGPRKPRTNEKVCSQLMSRISVCYFFLHSRCISPTLVAVWFKSPLNLRGLIWLLVWSKRGNIDTAALITIVQCNTLVAWCSRQLIGPADLVFVTLGPLRCD